MTNSEPIAELLSQIRQLLELHGENPFKVRAYEKAADAVLAHSDLRARAQAGTLTELAGIGKGIAEVITEYFETGQSSLKTELEKGLPPGLTELVKVPGLGPKKARLLIDELKVQSLAELEYACRENRLLELKGFGPRAQDKILDGILFLRANAGHLRIVDALPVVDGVERVLRGACRDAEAGEVSLTGALRRRLEIVDRISYLVELPTKAGAEWRSKIEKSVGKQVSKLGLSLPVEVFFAPHGRFGFELARTTGSEEHWKALGSPKPFDAATEEGFYEKLGLPWIPPEMRENGEEVALARAGKLDDVLSWKAVQGVFHVHSTYSDGVGSLEDMVRGARELGYRYIGLSDHSQSAYYARGLKPADLTRQEKEIRKLQEKYDDIRIFWGVESDILADGSLDYAPAQLKKFDFVIASIHSRFGMDRETMTNRILEAIRNPFTRFLGHATGRLLLGRRGYDVDMERIIREASKRGVAIEINAHPARLDIDWRWGPVLREEKTWVSINPDAHAVEGLRDTEFGIGVARKALLPAARVVNAQSVEEVEKWLKRSH